jgi:type II secretory pathway predicted ATPase ExeA
MKSMSHPNDLHSSIELHPCAATQWGAAKICDEAFCANMYKDFFGLRENPFNVNPDPRFLFLTPQTQEALDELTYGIQARKGLILLTGEVGTGKTTLLNRVLDWLRLQKTPTAFIFNSHLEISHLFDFILADFGISSDARLKGNALLRLNHWLLERYCAGETPVLIVDEAQGLADHVLEEIRMLLNLETPSEKLLQIVLSGQPELETRLQRPELRQIKQRITLRCSTATLTLGETHDYIRARLHIAGANGKPVFASESMDSVHFYSRGIPRVINLLCEHALIHAYVDQVQPVPAHIIQEVAREFQFDDGKPVAPFTDSSTAPDSAWNAIPSPFMNAPASLPATTDHASGPFAVADIALRPAKEARPLVMNSGLLPERREDVRSFKSLGAQAAEPAAHGQTRSEVNRPSELAGFFSDLRIQFGSDGAFEPPPLALQALLHRGEEKEKFELLRSSRSSRIPNPLKLSRLAKTAGPTKSGPYRSLLAKTLGAYFRSPTWTPRGRDRFLSTPNFPARTEWNLILSHQPNRAPQRQRAWYRLCLACKDRCLIPVGLIDWPRKKAVFYRWLQQPWDPTQWRLPNSWLFEARRRFSYKKM